MKFDIITIFPKIFENYFSESILKKAQEKKLIEIKVHNLRDFTKDKHKTVDGKTYGGGPGMILMIEPIYKALKFVKQRNRKIKKRRVILLTPKGKILNQKTAEKLSKYEQLIFICGRYEGFDARVEKIVDEKISVGPYILTGGELPAMIMVDAITRLIPNVISPHSLKDETIMKIKGSTLKVIDEYPQYTRPEVFLNWKVPKILVSGNHKKISDWRKKKRKEKKNKLT